MATLINSPVPEFNNKVPVYKVERCLRCDGLFFVNVITGEKVEARCKSYSCDFCGPKKAFKLECALEKYFSKFMRMWTFNVRTHLFDKHPDGIFAISEVWRRFITYLRRNNALSKKEQSFSYVKVLEFTKRNYPHFHVLWMSFCLMKLFKDAGSWLLIVLLALACVMVGRVL